MQNILAETLRCHPPVKGLPRVVVVAAKNMQEDEEEKDETEEQEYKDKEVRASSRYA